MSPRVRVLFVTSELFPLVKTGGLADVSAALPPALRAAGTDCRVLLPGYPGVMEALTLTPVVRGLRLIPAVSRAATLWAGKLPDTGVPVYVLDCPALYDRDGGPYQAPDGSPWPDNAQRFGLLGAAAAMLGNDESPLEWQPEVLHLNDWQAGLAGAFRAFDERPGARVLATVHNLSFVGDFPAAMTPFLGLPGESYGIAGTEFYGRLSFLKAGLFYADHLTTVSPTYAREIQTPAFGCGLDGLLRTRARALTGIVNGVDTNTWDPRKDPHLAAPYGKDPAPAKRANRAALRTRLGLSTTPEGPLLGLVSRLTAQKGIDLILACAAGWLRTGAELAVLGTGDPALEAGLLALARAYPGQVAVVIGYDEALSHLMEAGLDVFLMPSRFEPCGLNQLYSLRYATPPVVRRTGGLADTVIDEREGKAATGFVFESATAAALDDAVRRAMHCFAQPKRWQALQRSGQAVDVSWQVPALAYGEIYAGLQSAGPR